MRAPAGSRSRAEPGPVLARRISAGNPAWAKAPFALVRFPTLLASMAACALVLAAATATEPVFVSDAGTASLRQRVELSSRWDAGLSVAAYGRLAEGSGADLARRRTAFIEGLARGADDLGPVTFTAYGSTVTATGARAAGPGVLVTRSGFRSHLVGRSGAGGEGLWLPLRTAASLGARPGEKLRLRVGVHSVSVRVAGTYRRLDLDTGFWDPVTGPGPSDQYRSLFIADLPTMQRIAGPLDQVLRFTWELPLASSSMALPDARRVAGRIGSMESVLDDPGDPRVRALFPSATHKSSLASLVQESSDTQAALAGPVGTISLAGRAVAMIAVGVAAAYGARRRRIEIGLLMARGARPAAVGARAALESLLPVALGSAAGLALALGLVGRLGPGSAHDPAAERWAAVLVGAGAAAALVLVAAVTAVTAVREGEEPEHGRLRELASRAPWEGLVLLIAAASYLEIVLRGGGAVSVRGGTPRLDVLVLLFPMLFVAGMAGLAGRLLARVLPAVRRAGTAWRPSLYLAARRVAAAPRMTVLLVTAIAIALGILVYASSLAGSVRGSLADKALVLNGAPTRVVLGLDARGIPGTLPVPATEVIRAKAATVQPSGTHVDLLGIDRGTFLRAVPDAALRLDRSAAEALASLRPRLGGRIPVVVAGGSLAPGASLDVGPLRLRLRTAARGDAFPGMTPGRPLLVLDRGALQAAIRTGQTSVGGLGADREVWSSAPAGDVVRALRQASIPVAAVTTTARLRGDPSFTPVSWIFGLLQALGVLAGLVASIGVVLYMQARRRGREVSFALASRMGLGRGPHRLSVAAELIVVLGAGLAIGSGLAIAAAALVAGRIDLLPSVAPHPSVWVPWAVLGGAAVAIVLAAALGAWGVQRAVDRTNVAEVIRLVD